jgi:hypothetical protein
MDERHVPGIDRAELEKRLQEDFQRCLAEVVEAIDTARIGAIIDDSEEPVRLATSRLRAMIFEKAIQMKADAAEAAFSPSAEPGEPQAASQGTPGGGS